MKTRIVLIVLVVVAVAIVTIAAGPSHPITWTPRSIEVTTVAGADPTEMEVSFTARENLGDVVVEVVPELADTVNVTPASFSGVTAGSVNEVTLTFSGSADANPETTEGTFHVRPAEGSQTLAKPLPVTVHVVWPEVTSEEGGFSISYPGEFEAEVNEPQVLSGVLNQNLSFTTVGNEFGGPAFTIDWIEDYPDGTSISDWADQRNWPTPDGDWRSLYILTTIASHEVLQDPDTGSVVTAVGTRRYYIFNGIGIDPVYVPLDTFNQILESLEFN